jgi:mono/diheme cytochrome c family protein
MKTGTKAARIAILAASMCAMTAGFAQGPGAEVYKTKCQMCHGTTGMADFGPGKMMKVKPASDPAVKKMNEEQMVDAVRNGMGKMQAYKDKLTDAQIKESVAYFRTFVK